MTETLYVGTEADCKAVQSALDYAANVPIPGIDAQTGLPIADEATRQAMFELWWSYPQAKRDQFIAKPEGTIWARWTLQVTELLTEYPPGTRNACWLIDNIDGLIAAAGAAGRVLSIQQALTLSAAQSLSTAGFPANWIHAPD